MIGVLSLECISLDAPASSPEALFQCVGRLVAAAHGLKGGDVADRLLRRESRRSTGLGYGIALPHADAHGLSRPVAAFVRLRKPIAFDAPDGRPVTDVLALLVPRPATAGHHDLLARYTRLLTRPEFRRSLERCADATSIWRLFDEHLRW
jgi:PTS system nitrogen regulatory IIA component